MTPELAEYVRTNRSLYTREAIDNQLLASGYTAEEIDEAWRAVEAEAPTMPIGMSASAESYPYQERHQQSVMSQGRFWLFMGGLVVVSYGLGTLVALILRDFGWGLLIFFLINVVGFVLSLLSLRSDRVRGLGLVMGVVCGLILFPLLSVVILFGICVGGLRI